MTDYSEAMSNVPNQMFNTNINGHNFEFRFRTFRGIMYADVRVDGTLMQSGAKCIPNQPLFLGTVNALADGAFMFICMDELYPSYELLDGTTCRFIYTPSSEA